MCPRTSHHRTCVTAQNDNKDLDHLQRAAMQGDLKAIARLGTLYRFGQGVEQDIVTAADLHVISALDGDAFSAEQLADYRDEIVQAARKGSVVAALCLAKMFDRGLGVEKNSAKMFAWLLWGAERGTMDRHADYVDELLNMKEFYTMTLPDGDRARGERLFDHMRAATSDSERNAERSAP